MSSRSPTLEEALRVAIGSSLANVHTAMPARVESYDVATQKCSVQPLVMNVLRPIEGDDIKEVLPIINDVPVMFPRGGGFFVSLPIAVGDFVLLVFNERSIDKFVTSDGNVTDPVDVRQHNLSDAVAIPGFYPFKQPIVDDNANDLVMGKDEAGVQLKITADNKVKVTFDGGTTVVIDGKDATAKLVLGSGTKSMAISETLQALYELLKTWDTTHTHIAGAPGSPTGPPIEAATHPAWDAQIASNKLKVPPNA